MTATTASTQCGCGTPTTATSETCGRLIQRFLDLAAGHILAAGFDHVLLAVDDGDVTLVVDSGEIAGMKPAAVERRLGPLVVVPIAEHQMRRAVHDLADLAGRRRRASSGSTTRVSTLSTGRPHEPGLRIWSSGLQHGRERRDLGLAVEIAEPRVRQALRHFGSTGTGMIEAP